MVEREFVTLNIGILRVLETGALAEEAEVEAIVGRLVDAGHRLAARETVTDSKSLIREQLTTWIGDRGVDVIVAIGGIDSTPTDPMLDALAPLVSRQFFGFGELFRAIIHEEAGTASIFSHAEAALCNSTYVILLPASGFTTAAVDRLLLPQLDHRTQPRNLAMSLPRLAGVPSEMMGGDTPTTSGRVSKPPPPPRATTGTIPVLHAAAPNVHQTNRIAVPPSPPKRPTSQISTIAPATVPVVAAVTTPLATAFAPVAASTVPAPIEPPVVRRPPTMPGVAPIVVAPAPAMIDGPVPVDTLAPPRRNAFADALKDAAQQRRTASVVAQLPKAPEPIAAAPAASAAPRPESSVVVGSPRITAAIEAVSIDALEHEEPKPPIDTVNLAALDVATDHDSLTPVSNSGTINMDALVSAADVEEPAVVPVKPTPSRVTAPPPFMPRATTSQLAVGGVPASRVGELPPLAARPGSTATPPVKQDAATSGDFGALAAAPRERERALPMFVEGRRQRPRLAVILLLVVAGLSVVAAVVAVVLSVVRSPTANQQPHDLQPSQPAVAIVEADAAVAVPQHDPIELDAGAEIEMPAISTASVDAGALALKPPPVNPAHPVPQHDPVVPKDAPDAPAVPIRDDGCDEVSCVLDQYARPCCAPFKPKEPDPSTVVPPKTKLDRSMVAPAVEAIKPLVIQCGERPNVTKGTVKVTVRVEPSGRVSGVSVAEAPDVQLGDCVAAAMQRAVFPATQAGGGFTYPFVF